MKTTIGKFVYKLYIANSKVFNYDELAILVKKNKLNPKLNSYLKEILEVLFEIGFIETQANNYVFKVSLKEIADEERFITLFAKTYIKLSPSNARLSYFMDKLKLSKIDLRSFLNNLNNDKLISVDDYFVKFIQMLVFCDLIESTVYLKENQKSYSIRLSSFGEKLISNI